MKKGTGSERSEVPVPFFNSRTRTEYGFARGGPVPIEPALLAKRRHGCRERASIERAKGMDARSERPARWHGPTPSFGGGDRRLGGLVGNECRRWLVVIADWADWW